MSLDVLPCGNCGEEVAVGSFPVFEGDVFPCNECGIKCVVWIDGAGDTPYGGHAYLSRLACEDCGRPKDPNCKRCGGTGNEPADK